MEKLQIQNTITINAPASKVWDALTNPEQTKKYMFGCEAVSDWEPGSPLLWRMQHEGQELTTVKGNVIEFKTERRLVYTVFDPNANFEDKPENYLIVTYNLENENGQTRLTVTQGDFNSVENGEKRYQEMYNNGEGWNPILVQIKAIAEQN